LYSPLDFDEGDPVVLKREQDVGQRFPSLAANALNGRAREPWNSEVLRKARSSEKRGDAVLIIDAALCCEPTSRPRLLLTVYHHRSVLCNSSHETLSD